MTTIISLLNKLGGQAELANLSQEELIALAKQHNLNSTEISFLLSDNNVLETALKITNVKCIMIGQPDDVPDEDEDAPAEDDKIQQAV